MNKNPEKARQICEMYHKGVTMTTIARIMNFGTNSVTQYLNRYYSEFYGEEWKRKQRTYNDKAIYEKFKEIYTPAIYTRKELSEKIGCSLQELEHMCKTYKLHNLRLSTYKNQKTLCNVPGEVFEDVKKYAHEHNMSIRDLVMRAVNEFMLKEK